jgi:hypothetical protein
MKTIFVVFVFFFACLTARAQEFNGLEISVEPDGKGLMEVLRDHRKDPRLFTELRKGSADGARIECSELRNLKSGIYWLPEGANINQERLAECLAYENSLALAAKKPAEELALGVKTEAKNQSPPPPPPPVKVGVPVDKLLQLAAGNLPSAEAPVFSTDGVIGGVRDDKKSSTPPVAANKIPEVKVDSVETLQRVKTLTTVVFLIGAQVFGIMVALVLVVVRQRRQNLINRSLLEKLGVLSGRLEKLENRPVVSTTDPGSVVDELLARVSALEVIIAPGFTATASNGHANGHTNGHSQIATLATAVANGHHSQVVSTSKVSNTAPPELIKFEKMVRECLDGIYFLDFSVGLGKRRSTGEWAVRVGACSNFSRKRIMRILGNLECEFHGSDEPGAANFKYILSVVPKKSA